MHHSPKPKSKLLQKHILRYNFLSLDKATDISYFMYPKVGSVMGFMKNVRILREGYKISFESKANEELKIELFGKFLKPVFLSYKGKIDELSINFEPNGINYFFDKSYKNLAPNDFQAIDNSSFKNVFNKIYSTDCIEERVDILDEFFLQRYRDIDKEYIVEASRLMQKDEIILIKEVAKRYKINVRTLRREFNNYIGCSPRNFKKIARFRNAVNHKFLEEELNYTKLAHEANYYDSSHFGREFKALTNETPSSFFSSISEFGELKIPLKYT